MDTEDPRSPNEEDRPDRDRSRDGDGSSSEEPLPRTRAEARRKASGAGDAPTEADPRRSGASGSNLESRRTGPLLVPGYRILQKIGEGGMGEVWEADQVRPVRRRVALKVIKPGMDSREVINRFEAERQALALMDHPGIAKVFDAGTTSLGRPYFAMELVRGLDLVEFCDRKQLGTRERLDLFLTVCEAVQHAHQKGIIHRDLKPSNILVAEREGTVVPRIIDFGVAKATARPLTEETLYTAHGQVLGTPEFMSPEQADGSVVDIDTRTDVYSLGVILYVLLAGILPFESGELRSEGYEEMRRKIREAEPPRPSTRVTEGDETSSLAARYRGTDPHSLSRSLEGDLDWIVLKCLEKDRDRRYETVNGLALDIRRHLADEPVRAARPSTFYRIRKFARRNRLGVAVASLTLLFLIVFGAVMAYQASRIAKERDRASLEAATAREVSEFLVDLFEVADPSEARGETMTVREVLDSGARQVRQRLSDQPLVQARLMDSIGEAYLGLGLAEDADSLLERGHEIRVRELGEDHPEVADSLENLSWLASRRGDLAAHERLAREALEIRESHYGPEALETAESLRALGWALLARDDHDEAEALFRRGLEIRREHLEEGAPEIAESLRDVGSVLWEKGEYREAEPLLRQSLESYERALGPEHVRVRSSLNTLAALYWSLGRFEEAEAHFRRSLEIVEKILGPESLSAAGALNNLGILLDARDRSGEAEELLRRATEIYARRLGEEHEDHAMALANLAWVQYRQGKHAEARPKYERALELYRKTIGPEHSNVATLERDYALLLYEVGDHERARELLEDALSIREKTLGTEHPLVAQTLTGLGRVQAALGTSEAAETTLRRAIAIQEAALPADHPELVESRAALSELVGNGQTE